MIGEQPHPHPDIEWGCPDCKSTDITILDRMQSQRGHQKPRGYCYDCGIRFGAPVTIENEGEDE